MYKRKKREEPMTREERQILKRKKMLSSICRECGRERHIPVAMCRECWKQLSETIN